MNPQPSRPRATTRATTRAITRALGSAAILALLAGLLLAATSTSPTHATPTPTTSLTSSTAPDPTKVVYPGHGTTVWRASGQLKKLDETAKSFRRTVHHRLTAMWRWLDEDPACKQAPMVTVKEFRDDVAFVSNAGTFPGGPGDAPDSCAGGGAFHFVVKVENGWRWPAEVGGQDVLRCKSLRAWDIPRMSGAKKCFDGKRVVRYRP